MSYSKLKFIRNNFEIRLREALPPHKDLVISTSVTLQEPNFDNLLAIDYKVEMKIKVHIRNAYHSFRNDTKEPYSVFQSMGCIFHGFGVNFEDCWDNLEIRYNKNIASVIAYALETIHVDEYHITNGALVKD